MSWYYAGGGSSYLLQENFEGSNTDSQGEVGYDLTGWVSSTASNTPRYATSPAPLEGSYSFLPGTSSRTLSRTISGNPRSFYALVRVVSATATTNFRFRNGGVNVAYVEISSGAKLRPIHGTVSGTLTVDSFSTGTTWHLWVDYAPGSGSNGVMTVSFSGDGTKPTSGNKYSTMTTGDATAEIDEWVIAGLGSSVIFDKLRASATEIGSNPA